MKIYTSYYGKRIKGIEVISISRYNPKWFEGKTIKELTPTKEIFQMMLDTWKQPFENLMRSRKKEIEKALLNYKNDIVLLCYEKDVNHCHRGIVSRVLKEWGYDVAGEYAGKKVDEDIQLGFF